MILYCISGQINMYKGGAAEIFKDIGDDYDNQMM